MKSIARWLCLRYHGQRKDRTRLFPQGSDSHGTSLVELSPSSRKGAAAVTMSGSLARASANEQITVAAIGPGRIASNHARLLAEQSVSRFPKVMPF